ncbi:MAG: hypothetical protein GWN67_06605 [Phycisphaerae bacterium]|nr:hypothetical protein [Phycisphaerae bacterium]NIP51627.1 hypothetical protein [Phycisphaerae bacterium]NIS50817.1 hypothetical protein [Phycisphaerae bacterium]NIU08535.1 hypothetical protein [Phycisphaerae bacterium]NIU56055.1 hypothetical protein [Phycisphaerae bacterium]
MKLYLTLAVGLILIVAASCLQSTTSLSLRGSQDMPNNNGLCLVCHLDFDEDPLTTDHLQRNITCAHCHGKSVAHMHDETMMTSPDVLYGRTEVESMCRHCHRSHKDKRAVENFRAKWLGKKRENGRNITAESTCTDCHGLHTISRR